MHMTQVRQQRIAGTTTITSKNRVTIPVTGLRKAFDFELSVSA